MKTKIALLFLMLATVTTEAAVRVEAWLVITNTPVGNTQTLVWNGALTRTWTNNAANSATQIQVTNSIAASRTNLKAQLAANLFTNGYVIGYGTNTDDVIIYGLTNDYFTVAIGGLWARVRYYTNTVYGQAPYALPYTEVNSNQFRIFQQSVAVTNLDYSTQQVAKTTFAFTNFPHSLRAQNPPMTNMNVIGGTNQPGYFLATNGGLVNVWASNLLVTNLTGSSLALTNVSGVDTNGIYTNAVRMNIDRIIATNATLLGASVSNATLTNVAWLNGYLGGLTNGRIVNAFVTNSPSIQTTNLNAYGGTLSNFIAHTLTVTNFSSPGLGLFSQKFGELSTADGFASTSIGYDVQSTGVGNYGLGTSVRITGADSIAIGNSPIVTGDSVISMGQDNIVSNNAVVAIGGNNIGMHNNTVILGYGASSTATNQIRLGTASEHVSIPGEIRDVKMTNVWNTGTNRFDLAVAFTATNITTLANGVNLVDPGFKTYLRVSGPTAAYSLDKLQRGWDGRIITIQKTDSYTFTINNESGSAGGAATDRILTGTGATATVTNNPGFVELIYDATAGRWGIKSKSN